MFVTRYNPLKRTWRSVLSKIFFTIEKGNSKEFIKRHLSLIDEFYKQIVYDELIALEKPYNFEWMKELACCCSIGLQV